MDADDIITTCSAHGLAIDDVRLHDGLLELTPSEFTDLPTAEDLQTLAALLKGGDVRWVTVVLPEDA